MPIDLMDVAFHFGIENEKEQLVCTNYPLFLTMHPIILYEFKH